jgi:hypothetical protein
MPRGQIPKKSKIATRGEDRAKFEGFCSSFSLALGDWRLGFARVRALRPAATPFRFSGAGGC